MIWLIITMRSHAWYAPLAGDWKYVQNVADLWTYFRTSAFGRKVTTLAVGTLETLRLAPKDSVKVTEALEDAAVSLVEGGKQKLFTPMMLYVVQKPLKEES